MYSTHFKQTYVCALRFQGGGELLQAHGFPVALWAADLLKTAPYIITGLRFLFVFFFYIFFLNVAKLLECEIVCFVERCSGHTDLARTYRHVQDCWRLHGGANRGNGSGGCHHQ